MDSMIKEMQSEMNAVAESLNDSPSSLNAHKVALVARAVSELIRRMDVIEDRTVDLWLAS